MESCINGAYTRAVCPGWPGISTWIHCSSADLPRAVVEANGSNAPASGALRSGAFRKLTPLGPGLVTMAAIEVAVVGAFAAGGGGGEGWCGERVSPRRRARFGAVFWCR